MNYKRLLKLATTWKENVAGIHEMMFLKKIRRKL